MTARNARSLFTLLLLALTAATAAPLPHAHADAEEEARRLTVREMELAEQVVASRHRYRENLLRLMAFYTENNYGELAKVAEKELEELDKLPANYYIVAVAGADTIDPARFQNIPAANTLFDMGMTQKDYPDLFGKNARLEEALKHFAEVLIRHPQSNKCPEAAFRMGEIYAGFYYRDRYRALKYFEAALEWNPNLPFGVRYRIADIYDNMLSDYNRAVQFYKLSVERDPRSFANRSRRRLEDIRELAERGRITLDEPL